MENILKAAWGSKWNFGSSNCLNSWKNASVFGYGIPRERTMYEEKAYLKIAYHLASLFWDNLKGLEAVASTCAHGGKPMGLGEEGR